nr:hypothetical protein [Tanacetum cinerariifolium]
MRSCLDDTNRVECLPNEDIFTELARIGYEKPPPKLIVYKAFFSAQWKFLIHTLVQCVSTKRTTWNEFSCSMASAIICLATGRKFNFFKYIFDNMVRNVDIPTMFLMYSWFLQVIINNQVDDLSSHNIKYTSPALTQKIEAIDADEDITLVDVETQEEVADIDAELQGRIDDVSAAATKDEKQEKNDLEKAKGLQQQYDDKQENIDGNAIAEQIQGKHLDNIRKYQSLKRKPVSIAQARKNMIIYLKNMAGYKMEHFRDVHNMLEIIPVSEFKVEALQVKYPIIDWEIHSKGSRTYWKIIIVGGITEAYQIFEYILKGFDREDMVTLWRLVKEKFKKNYPLSNGVMTLMLSAKLQVKEDSNMARDLVMKIFMEANKPKSGSLDTSSNISAAGSRLILLGKDDYAAEGLKKLL